MIPGRFEGQLQKRATALEVSSGRHDVTQIDERRVGERRKLDSSRRDQCGLEHHDAARVVAAHGPGASDVSPSKGRVDLCADRPEERDACSQLLFRFCVPVLHEGSSPGDVRMHRNSPWRRTELVENLFGLEQSTQGPGMVTAGRVRDRESCEDSWKLLRPRVSAVDRDGLLAEAIEDSVIRMRREHASQVRFRPQHVPRYAAEHRPHEPHGRVRVSSWASPTEFANDSHAAPSSARPVNHQNQPSEPAMRWAVSASWRSTASSRADRKSAEIR